jgi:DNA polymerase III epsilon subunit-like protein
MSILLALDFETSGLNVVEDRVIEVGLILFDTTQKRCLESLGFLVRTDKIIPEEVVRLTGISQKAIEEFGREPSDAIDVILKMAAQADAFIGQNVVRFDKRVLENWCKRENKKLIDRLWIDTRTDLLKTEGKHLGYMLCDNGWINFAPHSAIADCQSVLKLLEIEDVPKVFERAASPTIVLLSQQKREDNELAKKRKFRWSSNLRIWWKAVKELDKETEISAAPFNVSVAPPEILLERLWYD